MAVRNRDAYSSGGITVIWELEVLLFNEPIAARVVFDRKFDQ
jgi:hypothetical protein